MQRCKSLRRFILVLLFLYSFVRGESPLGVNLAPNPSFETVEGKNPIGWTILQKGTAGIDTVEHHTGKKSIAVFRSLQTDGNPLFAGWESQVIPVEAGSEYILGGWIKTVSATGFTYLSIAWYRGERYLGISSSEVIESDTDWKYVSTIALPPPDADSMRILFISQGNKGTAWLDDVSLTAHKRKVFNINLISNHSFEDGFEDKPYDWEPEWKENAQFLRQAGTSKAGVYSLSIKTSTNSTRLAGWKSRGFPAFPYYMYTFSSWVKTQKASGDTYLVIAWFTSDNKWLNNSYHGFSVSGDNDWVRLSVADTPPPGASYGVAYLRSDDNAGTSWFDEVNFNVIDAYLTKIEIPNNSFEEKSDFWQPWLAEGHADEIGVDDSFAYNGKRSLKIRNASGTVAFRSGGMQLDCNARYQYRVKCKVYAQGESNGKVYIWISWLGEEGWLGNTLSIPLSASTNGWTELSLTATPLPGARRAEIYLGCQDLKGTVWFDDVEMEQMFLPSDENILKEKEYPLEFVIFKHYQAISLVESFRLQEHFKEVFPDLDECKKIFEGVQTYYAKFPEEIDDKTKLFLVQFYFHLGMYEKAIPLAEELIPKLNELSARNVSNPYAGLAETDLLDYYYFLARKAIEKAKKEQRAKALKEEWEKLQAGQLIRDNKRLLAIADELYSLGLFSEARSIYEDLLKDEKDSKDGGYLRFKIGLCYFNERNYERALELFSFFKDNNISGPLSVEAQFYMGKSLRLLGRPAEAFQIFSNLLQRVGEGELRYKLEREIGKAYQSLYKESAYQQMYRKLLGIGVPPTAIYIGSDTQTLGDWVDVYGNLVFLIPYFPGDNQCYSGGVCPVKVFKGEEVSLPRDFYCNKNGYFIFNFYTNDPAEFGRCEWKKSKYFPDNFYLYNPLTHSYENTHWDDRGETHPFDDKGPDLYIDIKGFPPGVYGIALYMREHEAKLLNDDGILLAFKPRKEERGKEDVPSLYEYFVVFGPIDITVYIRKGRSLCSILEGIFIDKLFPPKPLPEIKAGDNGSAAVDSVFEKAKRIYEDMINKWWEKPNEFYTNLETFREIIQLLNDFVSSSNSQEKIVLAKWMMWQSYNQIIGETQNQVAALEQFMRAYLNLKNGRGFSGLREIMLELFNEGRRREAKWFAYLYLKLFAEMMRNPTAFTEELAKIIENNPNDSLFYEKIFENCISIVLNNFSQEEAIDMIDKLIVRMPQFNNDYLIQYAAAKIREKKPQIALPFEIQYRLLLSYLPSSPSKAFEEFENLIKAYPDFASRDEMDELCIRLLSSALSIPEIDESKLTNLIHIMETKRPKSPALANAYYILAMYFVDKGDNLNALSVYEKLKQRFPDSYFVQETFQLIQRGNRYNQPFRYF
jgi:TolA-binding protein